MAIKNCKLITTRVVKNKVNLTANCHLHSNLISESNNFFYFFNILIKVFLYYSYQIVPDLVAVKHMPIVMSIQIRFINKRLFYLHYGIFVCFLYVGIFLFTYCINQSGFSCSEKSLSRAWFFGLFQQLLGLIHTLVLYLKSTCSCLSLYDDLMASFSARKLQQGNSEVAVAITSGL